MRIVFKKSGSRTKAIIIGTTMDGAGNWIIQKAEDFFNIHDISQSLPVLYKKLKITRLDRWTLLKEGRKSHIEGVGLGTESGNIL